MTLLKRYRDRKNVLTFIPPFPEGWNESPDIPRRVINRADQRVLIARLIRRFYKRRTRRIALLLLKTHVALGCRPSEACALKRKDLLDDDRVMIQGSIDAIDGAWKEMTKNRRRRISDPLPPELTAALRALPVLPKGFLFTKEDGEPFNPNRLSGQFGEVRGREYSDVTLNTFSRHTLATMVAREARENGIKEAARKLGNTVPIARKNYVQEG
jgi:integrase